jgi:hypothetical protein
MLESHAPVPARRGDMPAGEGDLMGLTDRMDGEIRLYRAP